MRKDLQDKIGERPWDTCGGEFGGFYMDFNGTWFGDTHPIFKFPLIDLNCRKTRLLPRFNFMN